MATTTRSLREYLQGNLVDFANRCDMPSLATATTLTSLVVTLASLREEGAVLIPEIYLCEDLEQTLKLLPVKETLPVGAHTDPTMGIADAIKKCSPLAIDGWCIYITTKDGATRFGLFRGSLNPLSISVSQTLFSEPRETIKLVRLFRTASGCVDLRNHRGDAYSMLLSDKPATLPHPHAYTSALVSTICQNVADSLRDATQTYLEKTIGDALNSCHGTIIAVAKGKKVPGFLSDGVVLSAPLAVDECVKKRLHGYSETEAEHALNASASLIKGMVGSDGITVFNRAGKLIAFNCFIASPNKVAGKLVVGGARTRAYEALRSKVGRGIEAVFVQSQDGWTKFEGAKNGR